MSTKTSIKRIALVVVSALSIGLVSGVSANAVAATWTGASGVTPFKFSGTSGGTLITDSQTASFYSATSSTVAGALNYVTIVAGSAGEASTRYTFTTTGSTVALTGSAYVSYAYVPNTGSPITGTVAGSTVSSTGTTGNKLLATSIIPAGISGGLVTTLDSGVQAVIASRGCVQANYTISSSWAPFGTSGSVKVSCASGDDLYFAIPLGGNYSSGVVGDAFVRIATAAAGTVNFAISKVTDNGNGTFSTPTPVEAFTIIVAAAPATLYAKTTVTQSAGSAPDADGVIHAVSTAGTTAGTFEAVQKDAANVPLATVNSKAVVVTLSGSAGSLSPSGPSSSYIAVPAATWDNLTPGSVTVYSDGRAGNATLTVTVNGVLAASQDFNFYSTKVASITAVAVYSIAPKNGGTSGALTGEAADCATSGLPTTTGSISTVTTSLTCVGATNQVAIALVSKDKDGNVIPVVPTMTSSDNAVVLSGNTASFIDNGQSLATAGWGFVHTAYKTAAGSASGQKATLTYSYVNTDGTVITSNAVNVTLGGSAAKEVMTLDSATYQPGAPFVLTLTATDSSGNPVYDGYAIPTDISSNRATQGSTLPTTGVYVAGKYSFKANKYFVPSTVGDFTLKATSSNLTADAISVTGKVGLDATTQELLNAAADAAAEAIDAANAATDAANLAAEAADAATVAAEEARDAADAATAAVEALAQQVAALMAALQAQLKTLANTVAKIAKKVKA